MRTVSFSSPAVRTLLNDHFVSTLLDTTGDPTAGTSMGHAPSDSAGMCSRGIGKQNVQSLFMTPDGHLFHTASGFRDADDLVEELQFALTTFRALQASTAGGPATVRQAHVARMKRQGFVDAEIQRPPSPFRSITDMIGSMSRPSGIESGGQHHMNIGNVLAAKTRASDLADGLFGVHYPMMPISEFLQDPRVLVGHESSSFSSVGSGGHSGKRIGN